jgi:hypothetical protein
MPDFRFSPIPVENFKEVCSRNLYTIDGLWFLAVEEKYGFEVAFEMNQVVWGRASSIIGKRLLKNLDLEDKPPLQALLELIFADPIMYAHRPEVVTLTDTEAVFRCIECPVQVARIRDGKGVYDGKPGCSVLFETFAGIINPRIEVTCIACAPNPDNPEYWCEWEFKLPQDKGDGHGDNGI